MKRPRQSAAVSCRDARTYSESERVEMLEKAEALGFSLEDGSELERYTLSELDRLVNQRQ